MVIIYNHKQDIPLFWLVEISLIDKVRMDMEPAGDKDLELMIYKIKDTEAERIAEVLKVTKRQAFNIKGGYTALSYEKALLLKEELGLEPEALAEIRRRYLLKKENDE